MTLMKETVFTAINGDEIIGYEAECGCLVVFGKVIRNSCKEGHKR